MAYIYQYLLLADLPAPLLPTQPTHPTPSSFTLTPAYSGQTDKERRPSELQLCSTHCTVSRPTPSTDSEHTLLRICMYVCMLVCKYVCRSVCVSTWVLSDRAKDQPSLLKICVSGGGWYSSVSPFISMFSTMLGCSEQSGYWQDWGTLV